MCNRTVFDRDQCFIVITLPILFDCSDENPGLGAKRWQQPLTIGNGLKSVSSGRAKPLMRACANNTPAWAGFGLSTRRGLSFGPAQSSCRVQAHARSGLLDYLYHLNSSRFDY
jgi:hypothetical protein